MKAFGVVSGSPRLKSLAEAKWLLWLLIFNHGVSADAPSRPASQVSEPIAFGIALTAMDDDGLKACWKSESGARTIDPVIAL
ncbi:MAG TPA: hypothetical protein VGK36_23945 [Candidatus Angelobacter sp.]